MCAPVYYYMPDDIDDLRYFMLYIPYNSDEEMVELQYYNAKTNQTFIGANWFSVTDDTVGDNELCLFTLRPMLALYFVVSNNVPFTPSPDDEMAVFIDDECCGVGEIKGGEGLGQIWLVGAFDMNRRYKKAHVRYYSAETKSIYRTEDFLEIWTNLKNNEPDTLKFK